jgi:hypothetical protein
VGRFILNVQSLTIILNQKHSFPDTLSYEMFSLFYVNNLTLEICQTIQIRPHTKQSSFGHKTLLVVEVPLKVRRLLAPKVAGSNPAEAV